MGLDQYLYANIYLADYGFYPQEKRDAFRAVVSAVDIGDLLDTDTPSMHVQACVLYWRKANAIHGWFVREVQGGTDDCRTYYVDRDKLVELRDLCKEALEAYDAGNIAKATELLTPQGGFFFGSTDVDEWWAQDTRRTVDKLTALLDNPKTEDIDFEYRSSW